jgi:hypothetical protein
MKFFRSIKARAYRFLLGLERKHETKVGWDNANCWMSEEEMEAARTQADYGCM